jgi:hypothetical protein
MPSARQIPAMENDSFADARQLRLEHYSECCRNESPYDTSYEFNHRHSFNLNAP